MRWPPWSSDSSRDRDDKRNSWENILNARDWDHYKDPRTVIPTLLLTSTILVSVRIYRSYLRRIPEVNYIRPTWFRKRSLLGTVTRVGDADNFHLFHTPGGRLLGWGWLPGRRIPEKKNLKGNTIHIRIAGIDAPEAAHFGKPAQPYSSEALEWLKEYILNRRVRAYIYKRDQYERVVATVFIRRWFLFRRDVGKEMLKAGFATVYEAKMGAEYGLSEDKYRAAEERAKKKLRGMWAGDPKEYESPRDYKTRTAGDNVLK